MRREDATVIEILMTTYNGAEYLDAQLESLFAQQVASDIRLRVRDDASTDNTAHVLQRWQCRYPESIDLLLDKPHTGDPGRNFLSLLEGSDAAYVMFCDQDDVWKPDKIADTLRLMRAQECKHPGAPVLVHSDLAVVRSDLTPVAHSFVQYQKLDASAAVLPKLIVQNSVTGCTVMINRTLRALIRMPVVPVLHDWWTALTASAFGYIAYLNEPTTLYRQHPGNAVGAHNVRSASHILRHLASVGQMREALRRTYETAAVFLKTYEDLLSEEQKDFLRQYSRLGTAGIRERARVLSKYSAFKNGALRAAAQILLG